MIDETQIEDIYKMVLKFCWKKHIFTEDRIQDYVLKIWEKRDKFDPTRGKLSTFVYKVLSNELAMELRRKKIEEIKFTDEGLEKYISDESSPLAKLIECEEQALLAELYIHCSPMLKLYLNGFTQMEIARGLNISQPQVSRRIKKELDEMRKKVMQ